MLLKLTKKPVKQLSADNNAIPAQATREVAGAMQLARPMGNSRASDCCAMPTKPY